MLNKPFLCTGVNSSDEDKAALAELRVAGTSTEFLKEYRENQRRIGSLNAKIRPSRLLRIVRVIFAVAFLLGFVALQMDGMRVWAIVGMIVCFICMIRIDKHNDQRKQEARLTPEYLEAEKQMKTTKKKIAREMNVPDDCKQIDFIRFRYTKENGLVKIEKNERRLYSCNISNYSVFLRDNCLMVATDLFTYAFDLAKITDFRAVTEKLCIENWPGPEAGDVYRAYGKLEPNGEDEYGTCYTIEGYCVLGFEMDDVVWELYMPHYSAPTIEKLIGRKAEFYSKTQHSN